MGKTGEVQNQEVQQSDEEDFDAVFAEAAGAPDASATDGANDSAPAPDADESHEATQSEPSEAQQSEADEQQPAQVVDAPTEPAVVAKPVEAQGAKDDEDSPEKWKARYLTLQGKFNKLATQVQHPQSAPDTSGNADPKAKQAAVETELAETEQLLRDLDDELPAVGKAMRAMLAAERKQILDTVNRQYAPVANTVQSNAEQEHFAAIKAAHADFEEIVADSKLYDYIEAQPAYLQSAMRSVLSNGTAPEVNDLLTRFKRETGTPAPAVDKGEQERTQLAARRQKQLEDAGAVHAKGGTPPPVGKAQADDFDGAFEEAARLK